MVNLKGYKVIRLVVNESPNLEKQLKREFKLTKNVIIHNSQGEMIVSFDKDEIIENSHICFKSLLNNDCVEEYIVNAESDYRIIRIDTTNENEKQENFKKNR